MILKNRHRTIIFGPLQRPPCIHAKSPGQRLQRHEVLSRNVAEADLGAVSLDELATHAVDDIGGHTRRAPGRYHCGGV